MMPTRQGTRIAPRFLVRHLGVTLLAAAMATPVAIGAQERTRNLEENAFTWSGAIPQGRWIMVRNVNGPIDVRHTAGDRVEVTATRITRRGDPDYVRFEVQRFGADDQDVLVCALWGENSSCSENGYRSRNDNRRGRDNNVSVEFRVLVPAGVRVAVHGVNGDVVVADVAAEVTASSVNGDVTVATRGGPVNARTVNGSVRAQMGEFELREGLDFSSVNGTVVAEFSGDLNAEVDLSTVNGRFRTDFPVTISGRINPRRLRATLGRGGPRIRLHTVNGNVELRRRP